MSSFLNGLDTGQLHRDLILAFPEQAEQERATGDREVDFVVELLRGTVDPDQAERTQSIPQAAFDALQKNGCFALGVDPSDGGRGLSAYNVFRVVQAAAAVSVPVGMVLALANGAGAAAILPALTDGPLRDFVLDQVRAGVLSGWADTEPAGQNNRVPATAATPTEDGTGYLLSGQKLFTGNGTVADLVLVTATVPAGGTVQTCVCFVDTSSPGFQVSAALEFMGVRGLPIAALRFDSVYVPRERVLTETGQDVRTAPLVAGVGLVGRLHVSCGPALALARRCLDWQRGFVERRTVDGRALGDYDLVQRLVASSLAEVYAMEAVMAWALADVGLAARWYERMAAKNVVTTTSWRIVDRTLSLFGGEGYETAESKHRRGVPPVPVERAFRDLRATRITGNVDFQLDAQTARLLLVRHFTDPDLAAAELDDGSGESGLVREADLSPANQDHLRFVTGQLRAFAQATRTFTAGHSDPAALFEDETSLLLLARIANELLTMSAALGRTNRGTHTELGDTQQLCNVYCAEARRRLADLWNQLQAPSEPDYAKLSRQWAASSPTAP